jgi:hypothetical protein
MIPIPGAIGRFVMADNTLSRNDFHNGATHVPANMG